MPDLINGKTPEEIKQAIAQCNEGNCKQCSYSDCLWCEDQIVRDALALIAKLEAERDAALAKLPKWISVDERLPEKCGTYLTATKNGAVRMNHFYHRHSVFGYKNDATHWMQLPEPTVEQKGEKEE